MNRKIQETLHGVHPSSIQHNISNAIRTHYSTSPNPLLHGKNDLPDNVLRLIRRAQRLNKQLIEMSPKDKKAERLEYDRSDELHSCVDAVLTAFGKTIDDEPWASRAWGVACGNFDTDKFLHDIRKSRLAQREPNKTAL